MEKYEINHVGELVMKIKKEGINYIPPKYDDAPLYQASHTISEQSEYFRPSLPWAHEVATKSSKDRSKTESPLKEWWKSNHKPLQTHCPNDNPAAE